MSQSFKTRKQQRKEHYDKYVHGWKLRPCLACNGSGYYDNDGSPECGACDGTGRERYKPDPVQHASIDTDQNNDPCFICSSRSCNGECYISDHDSNGG